MINIHAVLIPHLFSKEGQRVDGKSAVRSTEHKGPDTDLNVAIVHPYSALEIEIQAIFYQRTSILYERKGGGKGIGL